MNNRAKYAFTIALALFLSVPFFFNKLAGYYLFLAFFVVALLFLRDREQILIAMLFSAFFIPFNYFNPLNMYNVINPLTVLGSIALLRMCDRALICGTARPAFGTVDKIYFAFSLSAIASSVFAISVLGALNWVFYSFVTGYVTYRAIVSLDARSFDRVIRSLVYFAAACAFYGLFEYFVFKESVILRQDFGRRLSSFLGHPLVNGIFYASTLPVSIGLFFSTKRKVFILTSVVLFAALLMTLARGSWIAVALGMLIVLVFNPNKIKYKFLIFITFLVAIPMIIGPMSESVRNRALKPESEKYSSFDIRMKSVPIAIDAIKKKPLFGVGPFNAIKYKDLYAIGSDLRKLSFENSYLGLFVGLGIIGAALLLSIYVITLKRSLFRADRGATAAMRTALAFGFVVLLINMATFDFDSHRAFNFFTWLFVGLNCNMAER